MKKLSAVLLALITVLGLVACNDIPAVTTPTEQTPAPTPEETPAGTPAETDPPRPDLSGEDIVIADGNEQKTYIVVPSGKQTNVIYAKDKLTLMVESTLGLNMDFGTDVTDGFELLIGDTGRVVSKNLKATLTGNQYAIKIENGQIILAATDDVFLYDAMVYFVENYLTITDTKITVNTRSANYVGDGDATSLRYVFDKAEDQMVSFKTDWSFRLIVSAPASLISGASQGGCTDGTYFYQAFIERNHDTYGDDKYNKVIIRKYDKNGRAVKNSEAFGGKGVAFSLNHANDLTYNPNTNEIYVTHANSNRRITILDADTLEIKRTIVTIGRAYSGLAYSRERNAVAAAVGGYIYKFNSNMTEEQGRIIDPAIDMAKYTTQGICCDDTFIYYLLIKKSTDRNYIAVYDWYGNYICMIDTGIVEGSGYYNEGENIDIYDGRLCMTVCTGLGVGVKTYMLVPQN